MILLNLGSKHIAMDISPSQDSFMANIIIRRLIIFTIVFTATRDIWISITITAAFVILVSGLFNDNSKYCIIPKKNRIYPYDFRIISKEEYESSKQIIKLYEEQKDKKINQLEKILMEKKNNIERFKNNLKIIKSASN